MINCLPIANIRENLGSDYEEFFSKNFLVISVPGRFFWTGEHNVLHGAPAILQKMPIRLYVGFEKIIGEKITFGNFKYLDREKNCFKDYPINMLGSKIKEVLSFLQSYLKEKNCSQGININVFSELNPEAALNRHGSIATALARGLMILTGEVKNKSEHELFEENYQLGFKIENFFRHVSGANVRSILDTTPDPIFFCQKNAGDPAEIVSFSLRDKLKDGLAKNIFGWPLDFAILFSGSPQYTPVSIQLSAQYLESMNKLRNDIVCDFPLQSLQNNFLKEFLSEDWYCFKHKVTSFITFNLAMQLYQLAHGKVEEYTVSKIVQLVNDAHDYLRGIGASTEILEKIRYYLLSKHYNLGIKIAGGGGGGSLLIVSPLGVLRDNFNEVIHHLKDSINPSIFPIYCSWLDGFEEEGLRVEQDLNRDITPIWLKSETVILRVWENSLKPFRQIIFKSVLNKFISNFDIFIDTRTAKIYLKGQSLNSQQLHSQKATAILLKGLLNRLGEEVKSTEIKLQTIYTRDRNEMQSKIISPFLHVTQEVFDQRLPLRLKGGLGSNFVLELGKNKLKIALLE